MIAEHATVVALVCLSAALTLSGCSLPAGTTPPVLIEPAATAAASSAVLLTATLPPLAVALPSPALVIPSTAESTPSSTPTAAVTHSLEVAPSVDAARSVDAIEIGRSTNGRTLTAHRLGAAHDVAHDVAHVVVVGGIHGGYEWNSISLAHRILEHFSLFPQAIPPGVTLHVIPNANPDGLYAITGSDEIFAPVDMGGTDDAGADPDPGRFNGNGVDLNRNWDCNWSSTALWRDQPVSGGSAPFSEPETLALRDYLLSLNPVVVVFLHSAANAVYVSGCSEPHPPSRELALIYGQAANYPVRDVFDHYAITGDAGDWLTTQGIASFAVELYSHQSLDWEQNLAGLLSLLSYISDQAGSTPEAPAVEQEATP